MQQLFKFYGVSLFIEKQDLEAEFSARYADRLNLIDMQIFNEEGPEPTDSSIFATVEPASTGISTFGLNIRHIDFINRVLQLNVSPASFAAIRNEYQAQLLQIRKAV